MRARARTPRCILITGASGALGGALAAEYAAPDVTVILHGRDRARLAAVADTCRARGARVLTQAGDLREVAALRSWLTELSAAEAIDLFIANAGTSTHIGVDGAAERWDATEALLDINVKGTVASIDAVLPAMRRRASGQIAVISSLAAYHGLPIMPSYSASKAALKAYGEALRGGLLPEGIRVSVVMPGYVDSPMSRATPGPKPWVWTPERAARRIRGGLAADQPRISFPAPLSWGCWWLSVLPPRLAGSLLRLLNYGG